MKINPRSIILSSLLVGLGLTVSSAETSPDPSWRKAATNKIRAQQIVNETMAAHPELVVIGLHAAAPDDKEERMIATNLDRVGKLDDDDDKAAVIDHKIILAPNPTDPHKFEVQISLQDAAGHTLPAGAGLVFKYQAGDDPVQILTKAVKIRDEMAKKTPDFAALFVPVEKL